MENQNQALTSLPKESRPLALSESKDNQAKLDSLLFGCFAVQKLYGRDTGNTEAITSMFHSMLGKYPADKAVKAVETWLERSQEFPTPADIIGLIKRNGRSPLSRERYIAISKKDEAARTPADWQFLRDYESEQSEGWGGVAERDDVKAQSLSTDNGRLREENRNLKNEVRRLGDLLHAARAAKGIEKPVPDKQKQVQDTITAMIATGARQEDVDRFAKENGVELAA